MDKNTSLEEDEEEKEQYFSDVMPVSHDPQVVNSDDSNNNTASNTAQFSQARASPYVAPSTPLNSPGQPKTPSITSHISQGNITSKKMTIVPVKSDGTNNLAPFSSTGSHSSSINLSTTSTDLKGDVINHLPKELVETIGSTIQTLDTLILSVEDYNGDQISTICDKVNDYVSLLKTLDELKNSYDIAIPTQVLEMLDKEENTNPELFTKEKLEACKTESDQTSQKVEALHLLKEAIEKGL